MCFEYIDACSQSSTSSGSVFLFGGLGMHVFSLRGLAQGAE